MGVRWFINSDGKGQVFSIYKTTWIKSRLVEETFWQKNSASWEPCKVISDWNFFGNPQIDEVKFEDVQPLLSPLALEKAISPDVARPKTEGVPGSADIERALNRLSILPNPPYPDIDEPEKFVESFWQTVETPTIDPNKWDDAFIKVVRLEDLFGTDKFLSRKKVKKHIEAMGQALTPNRSYALVILRDGKAIIIDGHHRLSACWLLGLDEAPVWYLED